MPILIDLPADVEARYQAQARAAGKPVDEFLRDRLIAQAPGAGAAALTPAERAAALANWVRNCPPSQPLSDEAIRRERIYEKRS